MIRWTSSGAVSSPRTVQIRVERRYPGRVQAGAPQPTRSLSADELRANLRHFTVGMRTPRTAPCTSLVLSGAGIAQRPDTPAAIAYARDEGIRWVTLHVDPLGLEDLSAAVLRGVDVLVIPTTPSALDAAARAVQLARPAGTRPVVNVTLNAANLAALPTILQALHASAPSRVVLTYPFPTGADLDGVPSPQDAVQAVRTALAALDAAGIDAAVKGLPACYLGGDGARLSRTINRWYVDADHQLGEALLFFPGVATFYKGEACRYCEADYRCDGFFHAYLAREGAPPLAPVR